MAQNNTPEQIKFFRAIAEGDIERLRAIVANDAEMLLSFDYRNFGATPLTAASFSNNPDVIHELIQLGADPNRKSDWNMGPWSPLHCAIYRRDKRLAEYLLAHGATIDLHTAAGLGRSDDVAKMLDADPSLVMQRGGDGCQPLHFADTVEVADLLLERGADIDGRCIDHYSTPVQYLCTARPEVARFLLSKGATPDIFSVVLCGDSLYLERLLSDNPELVNARINQSFFPPGREHDVHNILTFTVGQDCSPLHAAAKGNHREEVATLIRAGLSPDTRGGYDQGTPLHTAAWSNCPIAAEALIDNGADIDAKSGPLHNNTPAGWAIVSGAAEVFDLLIDRGATCHSWFLDDARNAIAGGFDQVSHATPEQRHRILSRLSQNI